MSAALAATGDKAREDVLDVWSNEWPDVRTHGYQGDVRRSLTRLQNNP